MHQDDEVDFGYGLCPSYMFLVSKNYACFYTSSLGLADILCMWSNIAVTECTQPYTLTKGHAPRPQDEPARGIGIVI